MALIKLKTTEYGMFSYTQVFKQRSRRQTSNYKVGTDADKLRNIVFIIEGDSSAITNATCPSLSVN